MKGLVFTNLIELVEEHLGIEVVDRMLSESEVPTGGAYTAVGNYDSDELIALVAKLSEISGKPVRELLVWYGERLFPRLLDSHPQLPIRDLGAFALLEQIHDIIHVEVRKLDQDAELPTIVVRRLDGGRLELVYTSTRPFAGVAEGLIRGCCNFFQEPVEISCEMGEDGDGRAARFVLTPTSSGAS